MKKTNSYNWTYVPIGGVVRVKIESGEDIAHLRELDQKKWTVLSCPASGLNLDPKTLALIDTNADGKIRVAEIVEAAEWLTSAVKDKDLILKGSDTIALDQIVDEGLRNSARQILKNLGLEKEEISIAESSDTKAIFAKSIFNGDGVITPAAAPTPELAKTISDCIAAVGGVQDRSGEMGVNVESVEKFYTLLAEYSAWKASESKDTLPFGENTEAALAACEALKEKIADYFMRCKLITFDASVAGAVDVSAEKVAAIGGRNLNECSEEIATYPLARPSDRKTLPFDAINPAWQAAFNALKANVLDVELEGKTEMTEEEWNSILAKFTPFTAWKAGKKGSEVEALGLDTVKAYLADGSKDAILELIAKDKELEQESASIDAVDKLLHLYRDFYKLLNNYVTFADLYNRSKGCSALFEAGRLYIDERCCNLCIKVTDMAAHANMAGLSGAFLIYCKCTSKTKNATMDIVAIMTAGGIKNLRPGKNAIFYDMDGNDWDAVVTKIVDNPISIKQAFWSPYRKTAQFISEKIDKSAAEKDSAATSQLLTKVDKPEEAKKQPFDIGKFAGIFAAVGMAFAGIGVALKSLAQGIMALKWWELIVVIAGIMIVISGPACFIAWRKLRKRNLGPVLNANGWAINSVVLINILFGSTLTTTAKYPLIKGKDPFKKETPLWKKLLRRAILVLAVAFAVLWCLDKLHFLGIDRGKNDAACEPVTEAAAATDASQSSAGATIDVTEAAPEGN